MTTDKIQEGKLDAYDVLDNLLNKLEEMELRPLHILFNASNPAVQEIIDIIKSENVKDYKDIEGIPVSFLQFGTEELFLILLTDNPFESSAIISNSFFDNPDIAKSEYVM